MSGKILLKQVHGFEAEYFLTGYTEFQPRLLSPVEIPFFISVRKVPVRIHIEIECSRIIEWY